MTTRRRRLPRSLPKTTIARQRKVVGRKRRAKKASSPLKVRVVEKPSKYEHTVIFLDPAARENRRLGATRVLKAKLNEVLEFIRSSATGSFKIRYAKDRFTDMRILRGVQFAEEGDLMMLMMCHREMVSKVFQHGTNEKQP